MTNKYMKETAMQLEELGKKIQVAKNTTELKRLKKEIKKIATGFYEMVKKADNYGYIKFLCYFDSKEYPGASMVFSKYLINSAKSAQELYDLSQVIDIAYFKDIKEKNDKDLYEDLDSLLASKFINFCSTYKGLERLLGENSPSCFMGRDVDDIYEKQYKIVAKELNKAKNISDIYYIRDYVSPEDEDAFGLTTKKISEYFDNIFSKMSGFNNIINYYNSDIIGKGSIDDIFCEVSLKYAKTNSDLDFISTIDKYHDLEDIIKDKRSSLNI